LIQNIKFTSPLGDLSHFELEPPKISQHFNHETELQPWSSLKRQEWTILNIIHIQSNTAA